MRKSCSFILTLLVVFALWGCSKKPETAVVIPVETVALQQTQTSAPTETTMPTKPSTSETVATEPEETAPSEAAVATENQPVTYSVVDEYVYAITDVNIRSGPGTQFKVLDYLPEGDEINRIGIGTDGWSQVYYKGDGAYIRSKYLSYEKPQPKPVPVVTEKAPQKTERPTPSDEDDFESTEDFVDFAPIVSQPLAEPVPVVPQTPAEVAPVAPQMPSVQPAEAPSYVEPERIDVSALTAHVNSFAASLGFGIDYSVRDGYFPPDTVGFSSMNAAYSNVEGNVMVLYNNIIARDGSIDGYRCCVTVSDNGDGTYTTTVYYG